MTWYHIQKPPEWKKKTQKRSSWPERTGGSRETGETKCVCQNQNRNSGGRWDGCLERESEVRLRRERAERVKKKKTSQELLLLTAFTGLRSNRRLAGSLIGEWTAGTFDPRSLWTLANLPAEEKERERDGEETDAERSERKQMQRGREGDYKAVKINKQLKGSELGITSSPKVFFSVCHTGLFFLSD